MTSSPLFPVIVVADLFSPLESDRLHVNVDLMVSSPRNACLIFSIAVGWGYGRNVILKYGNGEKRIKYEKYGDNAERERERERISRENDMVFEVW